MYFVELHILYIKFTMRDGLNTYILNNFIYNISTLYLFIQKVHILYINLHNMKSDVKITRPKKFWGGGLPGAKKMKAMTHMLGAVAHYELFCAVARCSLFWGRSGGRCASRFIFILGQFCGLLRVTPYWLVGWLVG